jgi:hypothetical protein
MRVFRSLTVKPSRAIMLRMAAIAGMAVFRQQITKSSA